MKGKEPLWELHISRDENKYYYLIQDPERGAVSSRGELTVPSTSRERVLDTLNYFLALLGGRGGPTQSQVSLEGEINPEKLGSMIRKYLMPRECRQKLKEIESNHIMISTNDVEIPWELFHDGEEFLSMKNSVGRSVELKRKGMAKPKRPETDQIGILLVGNPECNLEWAEKEIDELNKTFDSMASVETEVLKNEKANVGNFFDCLEGNFYDIIHYAGHTSFDESAPEESAIHLYDEDLTAQYMLTILEKPPRLVYMNSCSSSTSSETEYLERKGRMTGLASSFLSAGVNHYIGSLWPVSDEIAREVSQRFYKELLGGNSIGAALEEAKKGTIGKHNDCFSPFSFILYGDPRSFYPKPQADSLLNSLKSGDRNTRMDAALKLGELGDKRSINILSEILKEEKDEGILWRTIDALGKIGHEDAVDPLLNNLESLNGKLKRGIVVALSRIGSKKAVEALIELLNNPDGSIRWKAIDALGNIKDNRATEPLLDLLDEKDKCIRWWSLDTLAEIDDPKAISKVKKILEEEEDFNIRKKAKKTLQSLKEKHDKHRA